LTLQPFKGTSMFSIRCVGALIYDGIVLVSLFLLFTAACLWVRHGVAIPSGSTWYQLILLSIILAYYFLSYQRGGQTLGMRAWRLKLVPKTAHLNKTQVLARLLLPAPALIYAVFCIKGPRKLLNDWTQSHIVILYV